MMRGGGRGAKHFPTTHWSLVGRAGHDDAERREALGELLQEYLPALHAHLVQVRRLTDEEADDVLQDFVAARIIERDLLAQANRELGRFRTYLLTTLNRFLIDRIRMQKAQKRAADAGAILGDAAEQVADHASCDVFDAAWARSVLAESLGQMQAECRESARADVWGVFEARLLDPLLKGTEPAAYESLTAQFGLRSVEQASNVFITAKRMFARIVRQVVGRYSLGSDEIESEIRDLYEILARNRNGS